jgi:4'-phosphopantetheinyl transferase
VIFSEPLHTLSLSPENVLLWHLDFEEAQPFMRRLRLLLSPDETKRAGQFAHKEAGLHYTITRGILRLLTGRYLEISPRRIGLSYEKYGKPQVMIPPARGNLEFNLAHTDQSVLFAFARSTRVGIDIEKIKHKDIEKVAVYAFPERVSSALLALPPLRQVHQFYLLWTRMEAFAKAIGLGVGALREEMAPDFSATPPIRCQFQGSTWTITDIEIDENLAASLCREGASGAVEAYEVKAKTIDNLLNASDAF